MLMRFCFKNLLGYFRRKSLINQYFFPIMLSLKNTVKKKQIPFALIFEKVSFSLSLYVCVTEGVIDLQITPLAAYLK